MNVGTEPVNTGLQEKAPSPQTSEGERKPTIQERFKSISKRFGELSDSLRKSFSSLEAEANIKLNKATLGDLFLVDDGKELEKLTAGLQDLTKNTQARLPDGEEAAPDNTTEQQTTKKEEVSLEDQIKKLEKELGIETKTDRLAEASLLIDKKFLDRAVISGNDNVERLFGEKAWADWLSARKQAREYREKKLSFDFIQILHKKLTERSNPLISGDIRWSYIAGGDYKTLGAPAEYTDEQIGILKSNEYADFQPFKDPVTSTIDNPNRGFIVYPYTGSQNPYSENSKKPEDLLHTDEARGVFEEGYKSNQALVKGMLTDLCLWYNSEKAKPDHDPFVLAAELQRKFVSIHPFKDVNGRLSRLLMNWSLEDDGVNPSILEEPGNDILISSKDWIKSVKEGGQRHKEIKTRGKELEAFGYKDTAEILGLSEDKTFYDQIYRHIKAAPEPPKDGELISHADCEEFMASFRLELHRFNQEFTATRTGKELLSPEIRDIFESQTGLKQGGLISQAYIDLVNFTPTDTFKLNRYVEKCFYSDVVALRGGVCPDNINEQDVVRMFENFVGLGTGYQALAKSYTYPLSKRSVPREAVAESLKNYNLLISACYLKRHYSETIDTEQLLRTGDNEIINVINSHIGADISKLSKSPWVSTSLSRSQADYWSSKTNKSRILFQTYAPKQGCIFTFGKADRNISSDIPGLDSPGLQFRFPTEGELLIPGGINPSSIERISIYNGHRKTDFIADKIKTENEEFLVIEDRRGKVVNFPQKLYLLNHQTGKYEPLFEPATVPSPPDLDFK